jgi:exonuclease VII small subunit
MEITEKEFEEYLKLKESKESHKLIYENSLRERTEDISKLEATITNLNDKIKKLENGNLTHIQTIENKLSENKKLENLNKALQIVIINMSLKIYSGQ